MSTASLAQLLPANIFVVLLVMCRVGAALAWLPGFGAAYVPIQIKAVTAILIAIVVTPALARVLPPLPTGIGALTGLIAVEILIGSFLGLYVNLLMSALDTAGAIIAMQSSLSSAIVFNPGEQKSETLPASLLSSLAVVLIFATNMHHLFLGAVIQSYDHFPPGAAIPFDDLTDAIIRATAHGFTIAVQIAAPYLVLGTIFYVALGLVGRVMPQLQVFYVGLPLQVLGGVAMLLVTIPAGILWFLGTLNSTFSELAGLL